VKEELKKEFNEKLIRNKKEVKREYEQEATEMRE